MWGGIRGLIVRPLINHAVAIFVFLSGFLTPCNLGGRTFTKFVRDRFSKVLPAYIVWSAFFTTINGTWKDFPENIITGRCEGIYYYIFVYVQLVLFTPFFIKLLNSKCSWIGWIVSPISIVVVYYILGNTMELVFPLSGELFIFWFSYYFLGMYVRNKSEILKNCSNRVMFLLYIATLVLQYTEGFVWNYLGDATMAITQMRISSFLSSIMFAQLAVRFIRSTDARIEGKAMDLLKMIGDYSYGIYLIHMAVIRGLMKFGVYDTLLFPASWVIVLALTTSFIFVVKKLLRGRFKKLSSILVGA